VRKSTLYLCATLGLSFAFSQASRGGTHGKEPQPAFQTSDRCFACHNGMTTSAGKDFSIGLEWQASVMANSSHDPYWQAAVRRETIDHPESKAAIEDECSICHMPVTRYEGKLQGKLGEVFSHLPFDPQKKQNAEAADGVTCSVCHQIGTKGLGTSESYVGNFVVDPPPAKDSHFEYGPYAIQLGNMHAMSTSTGGFAPTLGNQITDSAMCGTCHTLITRALGEGGKEIATFYEQMPYPEWLHTDYEKRQSCQACHMAEIHEASPISSVLGVDRQGVRRHSFVGGNFLLAKTLNQYRDELGVAAQPQQLEDAAREAMEFLQTQSARVSISDVQLSGGILTTSVAVQNLTGHKLPTAYPSRRAWLHVVVRDNSGQVIFESGRLRPDGSIVGNDNDDDPLRYEPHYSKISRADQVQIYEDVMKDQDGQVTTGLLHAVGYVKDNRLLPPGFDKKSAPADIAVMGEAASDDNFTAGQDRVQYSVWVGDAPGPFQFEAELWYQPIGFRWAHNLLRYNAMEPQRFVRYYDSLSSSSAIVLAHAATK
jgi:hypothetical protein